MHDRVTSQLCLQSSLCSLCNPISAHGFDNHLRAYDRAAIKFRGVEADINFSISDYDEDMKQMRDLAKEEFVHILRCQSTGFSRGSSKYRGMTLHKCGRWEARMGQFLGKKLRMLLYMLWLTIGTQIQLINPSQGRNFDPHS